MSDLRSTGILRDFLQEQGRSDLDPWVWKLDLGEAENHSVIAVLCEDPKQALFQEAVSLCQAALGVVSCANDLTFEYGYWNEDLSKNPQLLAIKHALSQTDRKVCGYEVGMLNFTLVSHGCLRAVGIGLNSTGLLRAGCLALFISKGFLSGGLPHRALQELVATAPTLRGVWPARPSTKPEDVTLVDDSDSPDEHETNHAKLELVVPSADNASRHTPVTRSEPELPPNLGAIAAAFVERRRQRVHQLETARSFSPTQPPRRDGSESLNRHLGAIAAAHVERRRRCVHQLERARSCSANRRRRRDRSESLNRYRRSRRSSDERSRSIRSRSRRYLRRRPRVGTVVLRPAREEVRDSRDAKEDSDSSAVIEGVAVPHSRSFLDYALWQIRQRHCEEATFPLVKEEASEDDVPQRPRLDSQQVRLLGDMQRSAKRFDPAQDKRAWERWRHLARDIPVSKLRLTHDNIRGTFANGIHRGQPIGDLVKKLVTGRTDVTDLPQLVVACFKGNFSVIFGNRRLWALKRYQEEAKVTVSTTCIVHDIDGGKIPPPLLAKFILASTTENDGRDARVRGTVIQRGASAKVMRTVGKKALALAWQRHTSTNHLRH